jgi:hypothetical protein
MTGPALTPREAAVIDEALDVLGQIEDPAFPAPADRDAYKAFAECAHGLRDAVELHEDIRTGLIHPARVYDDLQGGRTTHSPRRWNWPRETSPTGRRLCAS